VMTTSQVVMVAVMTATPLDMHRHGHGLGPIGAALSAHTLGMFALSPLTGRLLDRVGGRPVMLAGIVGLAVASGLAAVGPEDHAGWRAAALFLLGYAWNLCFVGGSGALARDLPPADRSRAEGAVDAVVWGAAGVASLSSTAVLSAGGYAVLAAGSGLLVLLPVAVLLRGHLVERGRARLTRRAARADPPGLALLDGASRPGRCGGTAAPAGRAARSRTR
jgi:MFS family permease